MIDQHTELRFLTAINKAADKGVNPTAACALMLRALEEVRANVARGYGLRESLRNSYCDRLLAAMLRAAKLEAPTREEARGYFCGSLPELEEATA